MTLVRPISIWLVWLLAMTQGAQPLPAGGDQPLGLYVFMNHIALPTFDDFYTAALSKPYVDGAAIEMEWGAIEPQPGSYDWSHVDRWVKLALESHKKLSMGVVTGIFSPKWLYDAGHGVPSASFRYNRNPRGVVCDDIVLPLPWSQVYLHEYAQMMSALSQHLHELKAPGGGTAYQAVTVVKLSGVNVSTAELHLDTTPPDDGPCHQSDAPAIWAKAEYTTDKIMTAWASLSEATDKAFPDKILSLQLILRNGLPDLERRDKPSAKAPDAVTVRILEHTMATYGHRMMAQWDALNQGVMTQEIVQAGRRGARIGWQMNGFMGVRGGSGCVYAPFHLAPCKTMADFQSILEKGIAVGGEYIEIQAPNTIDNHDPAFAAAHDELWPRGKPTP